MLWIVRSAVVAIAVLTACSGSPVGRTFAAENELVEALGNGVVMGRFDVAFPARVERIERARGGIRFEHDGTPHEYGGVPGAEMHAVFVEHRHGRGVLVLRSSQG
jgi:hypothetical protein